MTKRLGMAFALTAETVTFWRVGFVTQFDLSSAFSGTLAALRSGELGGLPNDEPQASQLDAPDDVFANILQESTDRLSSTAIIGNARAIPPTETITRDTSVENFAPNAIDPTIASPDAALPRAVFSNLFAPDTLVPETRVLNTVASDTVVSDTVAPETVVPETVAPDTVAPDTPTSDTVVSDPFVSDPVVSNTLTSLPFAPDSLLRQNTQLDEVSSTLSEVDRILPETAPLNSIPQTSAPDVGPVAANLFENLGLPENGPQPANIRASLTPFPANGTADGNAGLPLPAEFPPPSSSAQNGQAVQPTASLSSAETNRLNAPPRPLDQTLVNNPADRLSLQTNGTAVARDEGFVQNQTVPTTPLETPRERNAPQSASPAQQLAAVLAGNGETQTSLAPSDPSVSLVQQAAALPLQSQSPLPTTQFSTTPFPSTAFTSETLPTFTAQISRSLNAGQDAFNVRLNPSELGRVDVRLFSRDDGSLSAQIRVERPETLDLFQRDLRTLERTLQQSGLKLGSDGIDLSLNNSGPGDGSAQQGFGNHFNNQRDQADNFNRALETQSADSRGDNDSLLLDGIPADGTSDQIETLYARFQPGQLNIRV